MQIKGEKTVKEAENRGSLVAGTRCRPLTAQEPKGNTDFLVSVYAHEDNQNFEN